MKNKLLTSVLLVVVSYFGAFAQKDSIKTVPTIIAPPPPKPMKPISAQFNLSEDGSRYIKFTGLAQTWIRETQNNPGSSVGGQAENSTFDIGMRRIRFQVIGQLTDRILFYAQVGMNNFNFQSERQFGFFINDALGEYTFIPKALSIGAGLGSWKGPLRYSAPGVASFMGLDPPVFEQVTNNINDQFVRNLMVYAKGKIGKLDYRVSLAKPFIVAPSGGNATATPANTNGAVNPGNVATLNGNSTFSTRDPSPQLSSYFSYQFFDQESNQLAYNTGTYHGNKRVFNIGGGFQYQNGGAAHNEVIGNTTYTRYTPLVFGGLDVFYDAPVKAERGDAISFYAAYLYSNYGPNFIRNLGVNNPASSIAGTTSAANSIGGYGSNQGNAFPMNGTGNTYYSQLGYKFKKDLLGIFGTLMPYASIQASRFALLPEEMVVFDLGLNWLILGHNAKFTFDYQNRPTYNTMAPLSQTVNQNGRAGMFVLQYQVSF
jgi:hypothetical protein